MIEIGTKHKCIKVVDETTTAASIGSGDMAVLATPAMIALMENAAMTAVAAELPKGQTTVGGHINVSHLKPSKVGESIVASATVTEVNGKKIEFKVEAYCGDTLIGEGSHTRFIVDREKFLSKIL